MISVSYSVVVVTGEHDAGPTATEMRDAVLDGLAQQDYLPLPAISVVMDDPMMTADAIAQLDREGRLR
jgi:hypothetical protein